MDDPNEQPMTEADKQRLIKEGWVDYPGDISDAESPVYLDDVPDDVRAEVEKGLAERRERRRGLTNS